MAFLDLLFAVAAILDQVFYRSMVALGLAKQVMAKQVKDHSIILAPRLKPRIRYLLGLTVSDRRRSRLKAYSIIVVLAYRDPAA